MLGVDECNTGVAASRRDQLPVVHVHDVQQPECVIEATGIIL